MHRRVLAVEESFVAHVLLLLLLRLLLQNTIPVETFIGPYVPPQNLTKDALKETKSGAQGAFAATISTAVIKTNAAAGKLERAEGGCGLVLPQLCVSRGTNTVLVCKITPPTNPLMAMVACSHRQLNTAAAACGMLLAVLMPILMLMLTLNLMPPPPRPLPSGAVKDVVAQSDKGPGAWSDSIGNAFLAPYELNADKSAFSANGTKGPIHQALDKMDLKTYYYQGAVDSQTKGNISR